MKSIFTAIVLIFLMSLAQPALSHKLHSHGFGHDHSQCNGEHGELDFTLGPEVPISEKEVQALIHSSHEIIEGDESASFFKRWVSGFNLKEKFFDAYRWASAKSKIPRYRDTVNDSLLLFGASHLLEMASGPIVLAVGAVNDWPQWVMGAVIAGGATISVPGLDPLCLVIFTAYAGSSKFRSAVGTVRSALMPTFQLAGLSAEMAVEDILSLVREAKIKKLQGLTRVRSENENLKTFYFSFPIENSAVEIEIQRSQNGTFLHAVTIHKNLLSSLGKVELKEWLQPLGWNARNLIYKMAQMLTQEKDLQFVFNKLYIKRVQQSKDMGRIELVDHAVSVAEENCDQILAPTFATIGAF